MRRFLSLVPLITLSAVLALPTASQAAWWPWEWVKQKFSQRRELPPAQPSAGNQPVAPAVGKNGNVNAPVQPKLPAARSDAEVAKSAAAKAVQFERLRTLAVDQPKLKAGSPVSFSISADELQFLLRQALKGQAALQADSDSAVVVADAGGLALSLQLLRPIASRVQIFLQPRLADGQIALEVTQVLLGNLRVPSFLRDRYLNPALLSNLRQALQLPSVRWESVEVKEGTITLRGKVAPARSKK